jgi:hypothetical protein
MKSNCSCKRTVATALLGRVRKIKNNRDSGKDLGERIYFFTYGI